MTKRNPNAAWGMLGAMVMELILAPGILGGGTYYLAGFAVSKWGFPQPIQLILTLLASLLGLGIALYRINQMSTRWDKDDSSQPKV